MMTDDEKLALFEETAAAEYERLGMDSSPWSFNMRLARLMGRSLLAVLRAEDEDRGFGSIDDFNRIRTNDGVPRE